MSPGQVLRPGCGLIFIPAFNIGRKARYKIIFFIPMLFLPYIFEKKNIKNIDIGL